ncbi:MAG: carbon storage regulator [Synergistales bacterium]
MLVLTRRKGESLVIGLGSGVEVTVLESGPGFVRLGIQAPREIEVWRKEILAEVTEANRAAATVSREDAAGLDSLLRRKGDPSRHR